MPQQRESMLARLAAPLLALSASCGGAAERPTCAVLVTFDTTRADALGCYGQVLPLTPNLDELARQGVLYEAAHTVAPLTVPAHASMLTGLYPPRHGIRDNGVAALPSAAETLGERARAAGLQTAAFVGSVVLDAGFGLDQGFERYDTPARPLRQEDAHYPERSAHATVARAIDWLDARDPTRGFFLWVHLWDPHTPYRAAEPFVARARGNAYFAEIASADDAFGGLMQALDREGLLDETIVVAVADHGEAFLEHDELSHGAFVWETTLAVPLIVRHPDRWRAGVRSHEIVSVADVAPTLGEALGIAPSGMEDGTSLFRREVAPTRGIYFESCYGYLNYGWSPLWGWLDARGKYVHCSAPRLYDWRGDRGEAGDQLRVDAAVATIQPRDRFVARAEQEILEVAEQAPLARARGDALPAALRAAVAKLGYAAAAGSDASAPSPRQVRGLLDPHQRTQEQLDCQEAMGLLDAGKLDLARARFEEILASNPGNHYARERVAIALIRSGRHREAIEPLQILLAAGPGRPDAWCQLGACWIVGGEPEQALEAFRAALEIDSTHVQALLGVVHVLDGMGREEDAKAFRERLRDIERRER